MFVTRIFSRAYTAQRLVFSEFGNPSNVLRLENYKIDPVEGEVLVKMLAAPVNPADINVIQGVYPIKPKPEELPASPGAEGVGVVVHSASNEFKEGEWVIPMSRGFGTWQGYISRKPSDLFKVDKNMDLMAAACLSVNPPTALRMLSDFEKLKPGNTVIQNGGTSGVGQCVIQLCSLMGLNSISIIRDRPDLDDMRRYLQIMGRSSSTVYTEEEFRGIKKPPKCQLALNCVSGKSVIGLVKALEDGRTLVTYGGMSKQPLVVPTGSFIFNDIKLVGFWMSRWKSNSSKEKMQEMFDYLCSLYMQKKMYPPMVKKIAIDNFSEAFDENSSGKFVLVFD